MNGRHNIFLVLAITSIGGLAFTPYLTEQVWGESGKNFDRVQISERTFKWTSHPDRIFDGNNWVNYVSTNTPTQITFESASISFKLDKTDCTFELYEPGLPVTSPKLHDVKHNLLIDSVSVPLPACLVSGVVTTANGMEITVTRADFTTIYDLNFALGVEWTHEITNNLALPVNATVVDTCVDCTPITTTPTTATFEHYDFDSKNDVHGFLKEVFFNPGCRSTNPELECPTSGTDTFFAIYESPIGATSTLVIDPTFSSDTPTEDHQLQDDGDNGACDAQGATETDATTGKVGMRSSADTIDCFVLIFEWDISAIPNGAVIDDVHFESHVVAIASPENTDVREMMTNQPSTRTATQNLADCVAGDDYVTNSALYTTTGSNKDLDLGDTADDDVTTQITNDWFAICLFPNPATQAAGDETATFWMSEGSGTPSPTLEITYNTPANPEVQITSEIGNIGDTFRINGIVTVPAGFPQVNVTDIVVRIDNVIVDANTTNHNQTIPYSIKYGPLWERVTTDGAKNITITVTAENAWNTVANETKNSLAREYGPKYNQAITVSQGNYNYTINRLNDFDTVHLKANRVNAPSGDTWELNCRFQTGLQALVINGTEGTWFNETDTGYRNITATGWSGDNLYGTCFNPDAPVFTFQSYTNGSIVALGISGLDDLYGGFIGVPIGVLFVAFFAYMATPKTAPTYTIFVVALLALISAAGFVALTDNTWGLIIIGAAVGLLVKKLL